VVNQQWPIYYRLGITKEELVQEGSLNLMRAAELFDPERGLRFSTYATIWTKAFPTRTYRIGASALEEKTVEQD
jgi:DNA-directed RNA polymerase sigma subunit (sigma70/sigma32)